MFTKSDMKTAIEIGHKLGNKKDVSIISDMLSYWERRGSLSPRQKDFAAKLIARNSEAKLKEIGDWESQWKSDEALQKKASVIAEYYLASSQYFRGIALDVRTWLNAKDGFSAPRKSSLFRMIENKYADKVWQSYISKPLWSVGQLVSCRASTSGRFHLVSGDGQYWQHDGDGVYTIIQVDSRPIDKALAYKEKQGGARYYRLLMLGSTRVIDVLEQDLKKVPKKLLS